MIVNPCVNATNPMIGLAMNSDLTTQKIYMGDTGLLVTQCLNDEETTSEEIYKSLLLGRLGINEGMFVENVVAQCFRASGRSLYFYSRPQKKRTRDGGGSNGEKQPDGIDTDPDRDWDSPIEIDFLIRRGRKICPVDVKSSDHLNHSSLDRFIGRFGRTAGQAYLLCTKDVRWSGDVLYLPLYMAAIL